MAWNSVHLFWSLTVFKRWRLSDVDPRHCYSIIYYIWHRDMHSYISSTSRPTLFAVQLFIVNTDSLKSVQRYPELLLNVTQESQVYIAACTLPCDHNH